MPPVSAVMITLNEAAVLPATLAALAWCDEIVVIDSGSTDGTIELCRQSGCRVIHHDFAGYGAQKRFAVECATHDWVFVVDADEVVSDELREELQAIFRREQISAAGFRVRISLVFLGRLLRFGGERHKTHLRIFDRRRGTFNLATVHEDVDLQGPVGLLRGNMLHDSYRSIEDYFTKFNRYTSAAAAQLCARDKRVGALYLMLRFPFTFIHLYFVKGLVFDGLPGFVWAMLCSFYPFVKYVKLYEMQAARRGK